MITLKKNLKIFTTTLFFIVVIQKTYAKSLSQNQEQIHDLFHIQSQQEFEEFENQIILYKKNKWSCKKAKHSLLKLIQCKKFLNTSKKHGVEDKKTQFHLDRAEKRLDIICLSLNHSSITLKEIHLALNANLRFSPKCRSHLKNINKIIQYKSNF